MPICRASARAWMREGPETLMVSKASLVAKSSSSGAVVLKTPMNIVDRTPGKSLGKDGATVGLNIGSMVDVGKISKLKVTDSKNEAETSLPAGDNILETASVGSERSVVAGHPVIVSVTVAQTCLASTWLLPALATFRRVAHEMLYKRRSHVHD